MSAKHPEEPSDDEESFDDQIFKPMHHPGKLRIDLQLRVPGEDITSRRAKRENLDRFIWTCCGATGLDPGCEDGGNQWQGIKDKYPLPEDHGLPPDGDYESELSGNRTGESYLDDDDEEGEEQQVVLVDENDDEDEEDEDEEDEDEDEDKGEEEDDDDEEEDEEEDDDDDEEEDDGDDEMDPDLEAYLARVNRKNWEEELWDEVEEHGEGYYHPGKLVLDADMGEFTPAELRTNRPQRTRPELFYWTCCDGGGNEQGCEERQTGLEPGIKEKYPVPEEEEFYRQRKRRRREGDEDEDDEDEDDEDEDDEDEDDEDEDDEDEDDEDEEDEDDEEDENGA